MYLWLLWIVFIADTTAHPVVRIDDQVQKYNVTPPSRDQPCDVPAVNIQISLSDSRHEDTRHGGAFEAVAAIAREQTYLINKLILREERQTSSKVQQSECNSPQVSRVWLRDCAEIQASGYNESGRYIIRPDDDGEPFPVYCDMETGDGGWTVFQRRQDGSEDFYLKWLDYKYGFGNVEREHWLGNDKIHRLTSQKSYKLRVDISDFSGNAAYAEYDSFVVADEETNYQLILGEYDQGTAGDSLAYHNEAAFSTHDADHDTDSGNCATVRHGAWWYKSCHHAHLNGDYMSPDTVSFNGISWKHWKDSYYSMRTSEMKICPRN